jgi:8-oxo-dGTP pyrophosphatase MutT (NUDIX family)
MINPEQEKKILLWACGKKGEDKDENFHKQKLEEFLLSTADPFDNENREGHITASSVAVNYDTQKVLLIWHKKLERWLQPGGHCEKSDESLHFSASRELEEETGLQAKDILKAVPKAFDIDVHKIPETKDFPAHYHYDVRFLFEIAANPELKPETKAQMFDLSEVISWEISSLSRFSKKLKACIQKREEHQEE